MAQMKHWLEREPLIFHVDCSGYTTYFQWSFNVMKTNCLYSNMLYLYVQQNSVLYIDRGDF